MTLFASAFPLHHLHYTPIRFTLIFPSTFKLLLLHPHQPFPNPCILFPNLPSHSLIPSHIFLSHLLYASKSSLYSLHILLPPSLFFHQHFPIPSPIFSSHLLSTFQSFEGGKTYPYSNCLYISFHFLHDYPIIPSPIYPSHLLSWPFLSNSILL